MADVGWGWIEQYKADVGEPYDSSSDFVAMSLKDASASEYKQLTHAAHAMIFTRLDEKLWDLFPKHGCVMVSFAFKTKCLCVHKVAFANLCRCKLGLTVTSGLSVVWLIRARMRSKG